MKVIATNYRLRVDYRIAGKLYNNGNQEDAEQFNTVERSSYPFDSHDVEIGDTFTVPGELVRVVEYTPTADNSGPVASD